MSHGGIKPDTECAEKRLSVGHSVVAPLNVVAGNDAERIGYVDGNAQMACESVARTAWQDTERDRRTAQRTRGLVDRTVATGGKDRVKTTPYGLTGQACGIAPAFCPSNLKIYVESIGHDLIETMLVVGTRYGIDN